MLKMKIGIDCKYGFCAYYYYQLFSSAGCSLIGGGGIQSPEYGFNGFKNGLKRKGL